MSHQRLEHVGVCRYEDVFLHELLHGRESKLVVCIVMEFCEKGDLAGAIGHHRDRRTPIPERLLSKWMHDMCQALKYIHAAGVLHRDLKSPNIFVTRDGAVKLGDFGLARQVTGDIRSRVGTPCYLAPEVLQSDSYAEPADVWGCGCIAFEAVTLSFLWDRKGLLAVQVLSEAVNEAKLPSLYSLEFRTLVTQMLDKTPHRRPSVSACISVFARCLAGNGGGGSSRQGPADEQQPDVRRVGGEGGGKPRIRKRDEAMNGVHAAVEAGGLLWVRVVLL